VRQGEIKRVKGVHPLYPHAQEEVGTKRHKIPALLLKYLY
jgi:hypothetical protein